MTEINETENARLFYDGNCRFCCAAVAQIKPLLDARKIELLPLQTEGVQDLLGISEKELMAEMKYVDRHGRVYGGADAFIQIARLFWWAWPFFALAQLPGITPLLRLGYKQIAKRRHCLGGVCTITSPRMDHVPARAWIPALFLALIPFLLIEALPAWGFMWLLAGLMFIACKWLTWFATGPVKRKHFGAPLCYFLLWPGMDPKPFLQPRTKVPNPPADWVYAIGKIALGGIVLAFLVRRIEHPVIAGWIGMIAFGFVVHFGLFHLLAIAWRQNGVPVTPLMDRPALATSLTELWGRRWNRGFNQIVHRFVFRPGVRKLTVPSATLLTFLVSGVIHDLVISLPARAGYGLPTAYFVLQGIGILIERSTFGRKLKIDRGFRGWLFMALCAAAPAYWLFHPPFVLRVFNPFLNAIGVL